MGVYGSGTGRVVIISSKPRQLYSLVRLPCTFFPLDLAMRGMEKRFMLKAIFLQAHWIVKLVYMLPAMI